MIIKKNIIFGVLLISAFVCIIAALIIDSINISNKSWTLTHYVILLEIGAIILVFIAINIGWSSTLTKMLSMCLVGILIMMMMIEAENLQPLFTKEFIIGAIILCINLGVITLIILFWPKKILINCRKCKKETQFNTDEFCKKCWDDIELIQGVTVK